MSSRNPLLTYVPFPGDPEPWPQRAQEDLGGPEYVVWAELTDSGEGTFSLRGRTQTLVEVSITIELVSPGILRVLMNTSGEEMQSVKLARRPLPPHTASITSAISADRLLLTGKDLGVEISLDPFGLKFVNAEDNVFLAQTTSDTDVKGRLLSTPFGFSRIGEERVAYHEAFSIEPDEHFYGFGEKFNGLDKRGKRLEMWNYDPMTVRSEKAYKNVPFYLSSRGYGIFVDSLTQVQFDMGFSSSATASIVVPDVALEYYVICGPDLMSILNRYSHLVGFPILPPKWAFGLWVSSGAMPDDTTKALFRADTLREKQIPSDVLHLDPYWMRFGNWCDFIWDTDAFPDPAEMIKQVKAKGFKLCLWINPYLAPNSPVFAKLEDQGCFLKDKNGSTYIADIWGGFHPPVAIIDFTHPVAVEWYESQLRDLLKIGIDVFKTDFGEGIPPDTCAYNGMSGKQLHNLYSLLYNDIVSKVTEEQTGRTGLVWGRSTYAGGQRHAAQWGGDPLCYYQDMTATLHGGMSISMCGHAFWSHDIGGFKGRPDPEVYIRWAQFGLFSPLSRAHGTTTRLPWNYGERALEIFRKYTHLRYSLLPYIYTYACLAAQTGLPLLRPMVLEFPDDPATWDLDLQYMFGSELMVAPIYNSSGKRPVYFPAGAWFDFWTHERIDGPLFRWVQADLDVLPLYVRAGTLLPTIQAPNYISEAPFDEITFHGYLLENGSFTLKDVNGDTDLRAEIVGSRLQIRITGQKKRLRFRLVPLTDQPWVESVRLNSVELTEGDIKSGRAHWIRMKNDGLIVDLGNNLS
jgi:alpha-D-xyloside xylohydrolase